MSPLQEAIDAVMAHQWHGPREQLAALERLVTEARSVAQPAEPVAWRYADARGHYRYRSYVPGFAAEYPMLKPVPLYAAPTAPQPAEPVAELEALRADAERMRSHLEGDCYCPCCQGLTECATDCTFAVDCPVEADRMAASRWALYGSAARTGGGVAQPAEPAAELEALQSDIADALETIAAQHSELAALRAERDALRNALELARDYVDSAQHRMYDGTNGEGIRREAARRLAIIDAARATLAQPAEPVAECDAAFAAFVATLPKGAQQNIIEAKERGESLSWDFWRTAWQQAAASTGGGVAQPAEPIDPALAITFEDTQAARAIVLDCMGTDLVSGDRPAKKEDRAWLYRRLGEVIGLLAGSHVAAPPAPQPSEPVASDPDSWEANAQHLLDRCPYTVWQRPGAGQVDLKASLVVTFQGMQMRLDGHPMYAAPTAPQPAETAPASQEEYRQWRADGSPLPAEPVAARIDPLQNPMRPGYFMNYAENETPAEMALRKLACWLGVGGYNAPSVDAELFHRKIVDGVQMLLEGTAAPPAPQPAEPVAECDAAFAAFVATLPKGAQQNIIEAKERGESLSWDFWRTAWQQAAARTGGGK